MTTQRQVEVAIIGGGPAGQSAALVAGRARLKTLLVDAGAPRNAVSHASHGFLTRDGAHASDLRRVALEQLRKYPSVRPVQATVDAVRAVEGGFELRFGEEIWTAGRLVVATGYRDQLAAAGIPDLQEVYGTSVFPCPFCDGFEHGDQALALFGGEVAGHMAPMLRIWSDDIVVFTNGRKLDPEVVSSLADHGVPVEDRPILRLHHDGGVLTGVELDDGRVVPRQAGFLGEDIAVPATSFAADLGVGETENDWGMSVLDVDEHGKSAVQGLYVVGDARSGFGGIPAAAYQGWDCMVHIVHELAAERWAQ